MLYCRHMRSGRVSQYGTKIRRTNRLKGCRNIGEYKRPGASWVDAEWEEDVTMDFSTEIRVEVGNKRGVLATVASTISESASNIENVSSEERDGLTSTLVFVLTTRNREHLARIIRRLRVLPQVIRIARVKG